MEHGLDAGTGSSEIYSFRLKDAHREVIEVFIKGDEKLGIKPMSELPRQSVSQFMRFCFLPYVEAYEQAVQGKEWRHCLLGDQVQALRGWLRELEKEKRQQEFPVYSVQEVPSTA